MSRENFYLYSNQLCVQLRLWDVIVRRKTNGVQKRYHPNYIVNFATASVIGFKTLAKFSSPSPHDLYNFYYNLDYNRACQNKCPVKKYNYYKYFPQILFQKQYTSFSQPYVKPHYNQISGYRVMKDLPMLKTKEFEHCFWQYLNNNIADIQLIPLDHVTYQFFIKCNLFHQSFNTQFLRYGP